MISRRPQTTTRRFTAPLGMEDSCSSLCISDELHDGVHYMRSVWEPTPVELAILNAGGLIDLMISGTTHPVMRIGVDPPGGTEVVGPETEQQRHDRIAPEMLVRLLGECPVEAHALVIVESILMGLMLHHKRKPIDAQTLIVNVADRVAKRVEEHGNGTG